MHKARCPKCHELVKHANLESLPTHNHSRAQWHGIAFLCPECNTILGTGFDPEVLLKRLMEDLGKNRDRIKFHI